MLHLPPVRAPLQEAPILLCDEATSALDSHTEKEILDALQLLAAGRTSLFVAHRLSTAAQCDQIVVLEQARLLAPSAPSTFVIYSAAMPYAGPWHRWWNKFREHLLWGKCPSFEL